MGSPAPKVVVAYDANCGPCSGFKAVVRFLDASRKIRFVSLEEADEAGLLDGLDPGSRYASFHLLGLAGASRDASVRSGAEAVLPLMRLLSPWGRGVSRVVETMPVGVSAVTFAYSALSRLHRGCPIKSG